MTTTPKSSSVVHSTFRIERTYPSPATRVFAAFSNQATKRRWFAEGEGWVVDEFTMDFRVGGHEISHFHVEGGPPMSNDTVYLDIVPDQRIVFAYNMTNNGKIFSASLATIEIMPASPGSLLVYTEQAAFLDGADKPGDREAGCRELLEKLAEVLHNSA